MHLDVRWEMEMTLWVSRSPALSKVAARSPVARAGSRWLTDRLAAFMADRFSILWKWSEDRLVSTSGRMLAARTEA